MDTVAAQGRGASDASIIMGENPWKSAAELLEEKRGPARDSPKNEAMIRGTLLEPEARSRYIKRTGNEVAPACLQSLQHSWLRASVDGISSSGNVVVEIKCGESVYRHTSECGCAPDYYYGQLQHILAVSGLASLDFWYYLPRRRPILTEVPRDDEYIARLIAAEKNFWNSIQPRPVVLSQETNPVAFSQKSNPPPLSQKSNPVSLSQKSNGEAAVPQAPRKYFSFIAEIAKRLGKALWPR